MNHRSAGCHRREGSAEGRPQRKPCMFSSGPHDAEILTICERSREQWGSHHWVDLELGIFFHEEDGISRYGSYPAQYFQQTVGESFWHWCEKRCSSSTWFIVYQSVTFCPFHHPSWFFHRICPLCGWCSIGMAKPENTAVEDRTLGSNLRDAVLLCLTLGKSPDLFGLLIVMSLSTLPAEMWSYTWNCWKA